MHALTCLACSSHLPKQMALKATAEGMCVVIGLQTTGEANTSAVGVKV